MFPGDVYNRPPLEKEFIYQATRLQQKADEQARKKLGKGKK